APRREPRDGDIGAPRGQLRPSPPRLIIPGKHGGPAMSQAPQLRPLGAALGTEALGIDLAKPLEEETFAWIHGAFAEHPVLVFRDQNLSAPDLAACGRRFGTHRPQPLITYDHTASPERSCRT